MVQAKVQYIKCSWDGKKVVDTTEYKENVTEVPADGSMTAGWYYLNSNITLNSRISLTGDTYLILGDGFTLDVKGLYIPQGSTLTIYAQSRGNNAGKINSHPSGGAAIGAYSGHKGGGYSGHTGGNIVIHGGTIKASCSGNGKGIGGGSKKSPAGEPCA